jgi:small-conductance mechanosensitive channel
MLQEEVQDNIKDGADAVKDIIHEDVWLSIEHFLGLGYSFGEGENAIRLTIGGVLLVIVSFVVASLLLRLIRSFITRKMERQDELKFISIFKFIRYFTYLIVIVLSLSASGINVTVLITASAALLVGLGLALQELFQDVIGGIFIMIDKSLAVGDIIELNSKVGRVFEIKLRTTRAITCHYVPLRAMIK